MALVRANRLARHSPALRSLLPLPSKIPTHPAAVRPLPAARRVMLESPGVRFSTYLGGGGYEIGGAVALDADGYIYVASTTTSSDLPTRHPAQSYTGGLFGFDLYVAKFSPDGDTLVYATYLGGPGDELLAALAVDEEGRVFVAGGTASPEFPTANALYGYQGGGRLFSDAFVARLSADGSAADFATYLGGSSDDAATALPLGGDGSVYVAGTTTSDDWPTTAGAFQPARNDTSDLRTDAFVVRLAPDGDAYDAGFATYLGGDGNDTPTRLAAADDGTVWVTGFTNSGDFPTLEALQDTFAGPIRDGESDAFLTHLSNDGAALEFSTYLGGNQDDQGTGLALDADGNVYVTGSTMSSDFPTTPGAYQPERRGLRNRFVAKLAPASGRWALDFASYVGSTGFDMGMAGLAVDPDGRVWIAGATDSDALPTANPAQAAYSGGASDAFLARVDDDARLGFSTFLGGAQADVVTGIALGDSTVCVTGNTGSGDFPTQAALQPTFDGPSTNGQEVTSAFLTCFSTAVKTGVAAEPLGGAPGAFALRANYPNPFRVQTVIPFDVKEPARVVLTVYDLLGRRIAMLTNEAYPPGRHEARFDATGLASGTYLNTIEMGDPGSGPGQVFRATRKMVLLR